MNDFGLKCCGAEQECKNNITGRKMQGDSLLRRVAKGEIPSAHSTVQSRHILTLSIKSN
jgi:hypothetical protein